MANSFLPGKFKTGVVSIFNGLIKTIIFSLLISTLVKESRAHPKKPIYPAPAAEIISLGSSATITFDEEGFTGCGKISDDHAFSAIGKTFNIYAANFDGTPSANGSLWYESASGGCWHNFPTEMGDGGYITAGYTSNTSFKWHDPEALVIKTNDGSEFKLTSFKAHDAGWSSWGNYLKVSGYKNGVLQGSQNITIVSDVDPYHSTVTLTDPVFQNVDEVRITMDKDNNPQFNDPGVVNSSAEGLYHSFDTFVIESAIGGSAAAPTVTTSAVSSITASAVTLGGEVTNNGGATVITRGFVYSTTDSTPIIGESGVTNVTAGSGPGSFEKTVSGLDAKTTYHYQAYATNSEGTSYGGVVSFTTYSLIPIPDQNGTYSGTRGFWFIAPKSFTISGLRVPTDASSSSQSVQVIKLHSLVGTDHSDFTSLAYFANVNSTNIINTNIQINAGDTIAVLGTRGNLSSYGAGGYDSKIGDDNIKLYRINSSSGQISDRPVSLVRPFDGGTGFPIARTEVYYKDILINTAPSASGVTFTGVFAVGRTLTGRYDYFDENNDKEFGSTYKWYRSDDSTGTGKTVIPEATDTVYTISDADGGKYISFEVTPNDGVRSGLPVESDIMGPVVRPQPEINVKGNGIDIVSGSLSPSPSDHTDFGSWNTSGDGISRVFTIENTGEGDLIITSITSSDSTLFAVTNVPETVVAGENETFTLTFDPSTMGSFTETITINSNDTDEAVYSFKVSATSTILQIVCYNTAPDAFTSLSAAMGGSGDYTYEWQDSTAGGTWEAIANTNGIVYQAPLLLDTTYYRRKVIDNQCEKIAYSNVITINVIPDVVLTADVTKETSPGTMDGAIDLHVSGGSGNFTYLWSDPTASTTEDISGLSEGIYRVLVQDQEAGCIDTLFATVVSDTTDPVAIPKDLVYVFLNADGTAFLNAEDVDSATTDGPHGSGIDSLYLSKSAFSCADIIMDTTTITFTVIDSAGNSTSVPAHIAIIDTVRPFVSISMDSLNVYVDSNGIARLHPEDITDSIYDACGVDSSWVSLSQFSCAQVGHSIRTFLFTRDNFYNTGMDTITISVLDTIKPDVRTRNATVYLDNNGEASVTVADIDNGSSDNCSIDTRVLDITSFDCNDVGSNIVSLTITDASGNSHSKTATVTVADTIKPLVIAQDITVYLGTDGRISINTSDINNGSSDNCAIQSMDLSQADFDCAYAGDTVQVELTVTDVNGNSNSVMAYVNVKDTIAPMPQGRDLTVKLNSNGEASISADDMVIAITPPYVALYNYNSFGIRTGGLGDIDPNDLHEKYVSVNNSDLYRVFFSGIIHGWAMFYIGTNNYSTSLNAKAIFGTPGPYRFSFYDALLDNCEDIELSLSKTNFTCEDVGDNTITVATTDNSGNTSDKDVTITVVDDIPPTVLTRDITVYLDENGSATIDTVDIDNGSSDACGIKSMNLSRTGFNCSHIGDTNLVKLTVTDNNDNSNFGWAVVTIEDTLKPVVNKKDITVYLDASGKTSILAADVDSASADACGIQSFTLDTALFNCSDVGPNTVTLSVTDINGNISSATATVNVVDTVKPNVVTQDITVFLDANGQVSIVPDDVDSASADACGIQSFTLDTALFNCSDVGPNTVTLSVTDVNGNINSATATVNVMDTIKPNVTPRDITVYLNANGKTSIVPADVDSASADICGIQSFTLDTAQFNCSDVGLNTVILSVMDINGNINSATATVNVIDTVKPNVIPQDITVYLNANGLASITTTDIDNGSNAACGIQSLTLDTSSFDCSDRGTNTVTLSAVDVNGNINSATATVTVVDNIDPVAVAKNITVYLDENGSVTISDSDVNNGSSDNCEVNFSLTQATYTCTDKGLNAETLIVDDGSGNSATDEFLINVKDTIRPVLVTKNITVQLGATGQGSISPAQLDGGSTDNCSNQLFFNASQTTFDCSHLGANVVTLTATDAEGNVSKGTAIVTVEDNIDPVVRTHNFTVYLDDKGTIDITPDQVNNNSTDNCTIDSLWLDISSFGCTQKGQNTVQLFARDQDNNIAFSNAVVTVKDTAKPVVIGKDLTVFLNAGGSASITTEDIDNGSSDNCAIGSFSLSKSQFECADVGNNIITLSATDASGNTNSTTVTITVEDTVKPKAVVQNISIYLDHNGEASITSSDIDNGSTDNCSIASSALDITSFDCSDVGNNTTTLTVTDVNGNISTKTATVTVIDTVNPNVLARDITVYLDNNGQAAIAVADIDNGSTDNCSIASSALDITSFDCADVGSNTVMLTVTDVNGNISSKAATVTVMDTVSPTVLPQDYTVYLNDNGQAAIAVADIDNGSADNCSIASSALDITSFDCADVGSNIVTLTLTDVNNNISSKTATVTVIDTVSPAVITKDIMVYLDNNGQASIAVADIDNGSTDNCSIASSALDITSFNCADVGSNSVMLTVTDVHNNTFAKTASVTVVDTISPTVIAQDITVYLNANGEAAIVVSDVDNGSSDNCSITSSVLDVTSFDCTDVGANTVILTVTDDSGNSKATSATVTVVDTIRPNVVTRDITVYLDANGTASITTADIDNGSTDNCAIASSVLDVNTFGCSDIGTNTVTLTITDANGNSRSRTAMVTVEDLRSPVVRTKNITVYLNASGNATITPSDVDNGSSDNCSISSMELDIDVFDCADLGQNLVILTVEDNSNNSAQASAFVTILDTISPVISNLPSTITAYSQAGQCGASVQWPNILANDNCASTVVNTSRVNGSFFPLGTHSVNVTATDGSGNSVANSFDVIVLDTIAPTFNGIPSNFTLTPSQQTCEASVSWIEPTAFDNCAGIVNITKSHTPGNFFPVGNTVVSYTATDINGNASTISFTVTVSDVVSPVISNMPRDTIVEADGGSCDATVSYTEPVATDNCIVANFTSTHESGDVFPVGTTVVAYTATDGSGHITTESFTITVHDTEAPVVTSAPNNDTVGACEAIYTYALPEGTDNCSAVTVIQTAGLPSGSIFPVGVTRNTFELRDASGNITSTGFAVVVIPQGQPALPALLEICVNAEAVDISLGQSSMKWSGNGVVNGQSFDPALAGVGRHILTYAFTDHSGCIVNGSISITVLPRPTKPEITQMASTTLTTGSYTTYQWYRDGQAIPGANTQQYKYGKGGNYQVVVTNAEGCENYSAGYVVGESGGGIGLEEFELSDLKLYPNPSSGIVYLELHEDWNKDISVEVYSTSGKKIMSREFPRTESGMITLNVQNLPKAVYYLHIRSAQSELVKKVIIH